MYRPAFIVCGLIGSNFQISKLTLFQERYAEIAAHLAEAQEQLRALRKRGEPVRGLMPSVAAAAGLLPSSLHREMHASVYSDLSLDSGISDSQTQLVHFLLYLMRIH